MAALLNLFTTLILLFGFLLSSWTAYKWFRDYTGIGKQSVGMYFQESKLGEGYSYDFMWRGRRGTYAEVIELLVAGNPEFTTTLSRVITQHYKSVYWECSPMSIRHVSKQPFQFVVLPAAALDGRPVDMEAFAEHFSRHKSGTDKATVVSFLNIAKDTIFVSPVRTIAPSAPLRLQLLDELLNSFSETTVSVEIKKTERETLFTDIASFLRAASPNIMLDLWTKVGRELKQIVDAHSMHQSLEADSSISGKKLPDKRIEQANKLHNLNKSTLRGTFRALTNLLTSTASTIAGKSIDTHPSMHQVFATQSDVWLSTHGLSTAWFHVRLDSRPKYYHFMPYRKPYQPQPEGT